MCRGAHDLREFWNTELACDLVIPLLSIYVQKNWKQGHKQIFVHPCSQQHIVRSGKQPQCPPTNEWTIEMWYTRTMGCYSALKGMKFWYTLQHDLENMLNEISYTQKIIAVIPFIWDPWNRQIYRDSRIEALWKRGYYLTDTEALLIIDGGSGFGYRWWWCLHNTVNVLNATELYTYKWLKWQMLHSVYSSS